MSSIRIVVAATVIALTTTVPVSALPPITFSTPTQLAGSPGGEPSIATDGQGNLLDSHNNGGPQPTAAFWVSNNDGATWTEHHWGGPSGSFDEDTAFAPIDGTQYSGEAYIADLAATYSTVCVSMDHGATFNAVGYQAAPPSTYDQLHCVNTPLGQVGPSSDRQWLTIDRGGRAYLTYHEFVSAQPIVFTTTNGGADGFAANTNPCGSIVTDPTIEANVPQDITGGTLVSKPVVDSHGNLYILFTTTTQKQNVNGKSIAGTFSQAYMAVSTNHCTSFTDYTIFDGATKFPTPNTTQFGDIFNWLAVDGGDNLYAVAGGFVGSPTAFPPISNIFVFSSPAASHGGTWSAPFKLTSSGAQMLPAAVGGLGSGQLALGYFNTTNGVTDPNSASGAWGYTVAESNNALAAAPSYQFVNMTGGDGASNNYHYGDICNSGTLCGLPLPGIGSDRSLLDYTSAALDGDGCPFFSWAGNPTGSAGNNNTNNTFNYVSKQTSACFSSSAVVPEAPLAAGLVVPGAVAALAVGVLRRRNRRRAQVA